MADKDESKKDDEKVTTEKLVEATEDVRKDLETTSKKPESEKVLNKAANEAQKAEKFDHGKHDAGSK